MDGEDVGFYGMQRSAGRARALDRRHARSEVLDAVRAEYDVEHLLKRRPRQRFVRSGCPRSAPSHDGVEEGTVQGRDFQRNVPMRVRALDEMSRREAVRADPSIGALSLLIAIH